MRYVTTGHGLFISEPTLGHLCEQDLAKDHGLAQEELDSEMSPYGPKHVATHLHVLGFPDPQERLMKLLQKGQELSC